MPDILLDGLSGNGIEADRAALVAFFMEADRRFAFIHVEVLHLETAAGGEPDAGINIELQDGAVPVVEDGFAGRQIHELPGADDRQCFGFLDAHRVVRGR